MVNILPLFSLKMHYDWDKFIQIFTQISIS